MSVRIAVEDVQSLGSGVWLAEVSASELAFLGGRSAGLGGRSIVLLMEDATEDGDRLEFDRDTARLLNAGTGGETVFVNVHGRGVSQQTRDEAGAGASDAAADVDAAVFWVTVGASLQENYEIGVRNGVWGVPERFSSRLDDTDVGDYVLFYGRDTGFSLARIQSEPYSDRTRLWPDGIYPHRIKISKPLFEAKDVDFSEVYSCLLDRFGIPYKSGQAAGRGIGGGGGVFRRLDIRETSCLFEALGWSSKRAVSHGAP